MNESTGGFLKNYSSIIRLLLGISIQMPNGPDFVPDFRRPS